MVVRSLCRFCYIEPTFWWLVEFVGVMGSFVLASPLRNDVIINIKVFVFMPPLSAGIFFSAFFRKDIMFFVFVFPNYIIFSPICSDTV